MAEVSKTDVCLHIPFFSPEYALLAYEVLAVDKELRGSGVHKELSTEKELLIVRFYASDVKKLRVAVNAFLKNVLLILKTINLFHSN